MKVDKEHILCYECANMSSWKWSSWLEIFLEEVSPRIPNYDGQKRYFFYNMLSNMEIRRYFMSRYCPNLT